MRLLNQALSKVRLSLSSPGHQSGEGRIVAVLGAHERLNKPGPHRYTPL